jgi:hypothetical protein
MKAESRLAAAISYNPDKDFELVAQNFDLLISNTDKILSTPSMANGALGGLHTAFVYFGKRRFPISALLKAWAEGKWKIKCENKRCNQPEHDAFVISCGGGLSMGALTVYCPICKRVYDSRAWSVSYFQSIVPYIPENHDGLRLDEIIEELGGTTILGDDK